MLSGVFMLSAGNEHRRSFLISWGDSQDLPVFWGMGERRWPPGELNRSQITLSALLPTAGPRVFPRGGHPLPPTSSGRTNAGLGGRTYPHQWPNTRMEEVGMGYHQLQPNVIRSSVFRSSCSISSSIFKCVEKL